MHSKWSDESHVSRPLADVESDRIDTELFINEIEKLPTIWDMKSFEYKDRGIK